MNSTTSCIPTLYNLNHIKTKTYLRNKKETKAEKQKQNTRNELNNN